MVFHHRPVFAEATGSGSEEQKEMSAHSSPHGPQADQKVSVWPAGAVRSWGGRGAVEGGDGMEG